jgi:hypothetical protein
MFRKFLNLFRKKPNPFKQAALFETARLYTQTMLTANTSIELANKFLTEQSYEYMITVLFNHNIKKQSTNIYNETIKSIEAAKWT